MRLRLLLLSVKNIQMMSQLCEQLIFIHSMQKHSLSRLNNKWISFLIIGVSRAWTLSRNEIVEHKFTEVLSLVIE